MDKYCSGCSTRKPLTGFSKNKTQKDGHANWCKDCIRKCSQTPENRMRRKQRRFANLSHTLYIETKSRARLKNIEFNLDESDFEIPEFCPVLNIPLYWELGQRLDNTPTMDRIIPSKGYTKGNVKIISWLANSIKKDCIDPVVFEKIALYIKRHKDE